MLQNFHTPGNYLKICRDSGCISANYNTREDYENKITLVTSDSPTVSGDFMPSRKK